MDFPEFNYLHWEQLYLHLLGLVAYKSWFPHFIPLSRTWLLVVMTLSVSSSLGNRLDWPVELCMWLCQNVQLTCFWISLILTCKLLFTKMVKTPPLYNKSTAEETLCTVMQWPRKRSMIVPCKPLQLFQWQWGVAIASAGEKSCRKGWRWKGGNMKIKLCPARLEYRVL